MEAKLVRVTISRPNRKGEMKVLERKELGPAKLPPDYMKVLIPFIYGRTVEELAEEFIKTIAEKGGNNQLLNSKIDASGGTYEHSAS